MLNFMERLDANSVLWREAFVDRKWRKCIAQQLRGIRERAELQLWQIARHTGFHEEELATLEDGLHYRAPEFFHVYAYLTACGVNANQWVYLHLRAARAVKARKIEG